MEKDWFFIVVLWMLLNTLNSGSARDACGEQASCGDCISTDSSCVWCSKEDYDDIDYKRCGTKAYLYSHGCPEDSMEVSQASIQYLSKMAFHNAEAEEEAIQLSPQKVSIKLRPNDPFTFPVQFRQAKNYPVDLYFVMDLSKSMQDDKQEISLLGDLLAGEMGKLTNNFKLGFGSFVDKETYPFIGIDGMWMRHLCKGEVCEPPYEFRNNLPLTKDTHLFKKRVNETNISVNMDKPEGGLDAIMQAVVCDQEIGWRNSSRKVLLFTTDDSFHHAGDGRLGGIVTPNDGLCHLDAEGRYNESLNQDYPSIGHLASVIASKKVNVIFAVIEKFVPLYSSLSSMIEGSMVGELANDSSNVVDLVRDNYNKISGTVELKADENDDVFVGFKAQCEDNGEFGPGTKCGNIGIGQNVTFEVTIEVMSCPTNPSERKRSFFIYPVGLNEKLLVEVETTCECECEKPGVGVPLSAKCNGTGTFECGACSCTSGTFGKNCECSASEMDHDHFSVSCKRSNTSKVVCEGRGQCYCGHCECFPLTPDDPSRKYDGRFCECNNYACDFFEEELCGGPSRGTCKCGKCECRPGLTGPACDCATDQEACRAKENGLLCNGKGECVCGACVCDQNDHYRGPTCEDCPICPGKCDEFRACVQCTAFESGEITKENCDANCTYVEIVDQIEDLPDRRLCTFRDVDDCDFYFTYSYLLDGVFVQRTKECPPPVKLLAIVFGTIAGTILIGLTLLFLWKFCVTFIDKKEFEKFEKEQKKIQWEMDENPLYQEASATFSNPTYIN